MLERIETKDDLLNSLFTTRYDHRDNKIVDINATVRYENDEIVWTGAIHKQNLEDEEKITYDYFSHTHVPGGWYRRKEHNFFYHPNVESLMSILRYRNRYRLIPLFTPSFARFVLSKRDELKVQAELLEDIKECRADLTKADGLPTVWEKPVSDMKHQKVAFHLTSRLPSWACLFEQGLGKTKVAIDTFNYRKELGDVDRCLVIAPLAVIGGVGTRGWIDQILEYGLPSNNVKRLSGTRDAKIEALNDPNYDFYLINYESAASIKDVLIDWVNPYTMVVLDEGSKIKNFSAARTKACIEICKETPYVGLLNGTPIGNGADELFPQWFCLDKGDTFGGSHNAFLENYFVREGFKHIPASNVVLNVLKEKVAQRGVRYTKDECLDLPEKVYSRRGVSMTAKQKEYYKKILNYEMIKLEELGARVTVNHILTVTMKLQQITGGCMHPQDSEGNYLDYVPIMPNTENPKLLELQEAIEQIEGKQFVVWARFKWEVEQIKELLDRMEITNVIYDGSLNEKTKNENVNKFQRGEAQAFIGNAKAGGFGLNLQVASYVFYYSNSFSYLERTQSEDRVHRIGTTGSVIITDIYARNSVDLEVLSRIKDKKDLADSILDSWKDFLTKGIDDEC